MITRQKVNICLTCVGGRLISDIISALRDAHDFEVKIVGVDIDPMAHGRLLCDAFAVVPNAALEPDNWIKSISRLREVHNINVIICLSDQEVSIASKYERLLNSIGIKSLVFSYSTVQVLLDKLRLLDTIESFGIYVGPRKALDSIDEISDVLRQLGYPDRKVVLKPRSGQGSRGVLVFDSMYSSFRQLLENRLCGIGSYENVMEVLKGGDISLEGYIAVPYWDGEVFDCESLVLDGNAIMRASRRRQLRNRFSPSSTGHIFEFNEKIDALMQRVAFGLGGSGILDLDIVITHQHGPIILDASARFSGSIGGSYRAGLNFLAQAVRIMLDLPLVTYTAKLNTPLRPFLSMVEIPRVNSEDLL
jgi:hypothetical protein